MNQKRRKRVFQPYHAAVLLLSLVLLTSHFVTGLYARYLTTGNTTSTARVAKIRYTVVNGADAPFTYFFDLSEYTDSGGTIEANTWYCYYYRFSVRNHSGTGTSEVAFRYTVTLRLGQTEDIMSFAAQPGAIPLYTTAPSFTSGTVSSENSQSTITFEGVMPAGVNQADTFVIPVYIRADSDGVLPAGNGQHEIDYIFSYTQVD